MAEFQEVMRHANRLCGGFENCRECPIEEIGLCGAIDCNAAKAERIIMDWAAANPESRYPTWREWQSATFPDAGSNMRPCAFGLSCDGVSCLQCPDRTIPADIAKKLGVEPIREDKP
jgi:hypothetical protein